MAGLGTVFYFLNYLLDVWWLLTVWYRQDPSMGKFRINIAWTRLFLLLSSRINWLGHFRAYILIKFGKRLFIVRFFIEKSRSNLFRRLLGFELIVEWVRFLIFQVFLERRTWIVQFSRYSFRCLDWQMGF